MKTASSDGAAGTQDILVSSARLKKQLIDTISQVANHHGFDYIETPILENIETLKSAESDFRIFYALTGADDAWDTGLRYDLTVPLARIVTKYWPELPKPFKRYQYGEVFRGEKPQKGRYRHFTQFDLDIVGTKNIDADIGLFMLARSTFDQINLGIISTFHINSRNFFTALQEVLGIASEKLTELVKLFDKSEKITKEEFTSELAMLVTDSNSQEICIKLLEIIPTSEFAMMLDTVKTSSLYTDLLEEFTAVKDALDNQDAVTKYVFNPMIARGFGYYTGMVCEMKVEGFSFSVLGGGRYDNLTEKFSPQNFPATGISFGIDRILLVLSELGVSVKSTHDKKIVIGCLDETAKKYTYLTLLNISKILSKDDSIEMYVADAVDAKSVLMYSLSKQATHMVIIGENEMRSATVTIKNLITKEQATITADMVENYLKS